MVQWVALLPHSSSISELVRRFTCSLHVCLSFLWPLWFLPFRPKKNDIQLHTIQHIQQVKGILNSRFLQCLEQKGIYNDKTFSLSLSRSIYVPSNSLPVLCLILVASSWASSSSPQTNPSIPILVPQHQH